MWYKLLNFLNISKQSNNVDVIPLFGVVYILDKTETNN